MCSASGQDSVGGKMTGDQIRFLLSVQTWVHIPALPLTWPRFPHSFTLSFHPYRPSAASVPGRVPGSASDSAVTTDNHSSLLSFWSSQSSGRDTLEVPNSDDPRSEQGWDGRPQRAAGERGGEGRGGAAQPSPRVGKGFLEEGTSEQRPG